MKTPRGLDAMVGEQIRRWEVETRRAAPPARRPCVALSRLPFSGGSTVAERVAERLGFGVFGKEIVEQIAREHGVAERLVVGCDERIRSAIDRFVTDAFRVGGFAESDYLRHVVRIVSTLGERGMAVIVGRGAPYVLPPERALRVLVVAPRGARADRLAASVGLDQKAAEARVAALDKERDQFVRQQFGVEQRDPELYDITVNTGTLSVEAAAEVVVEAYRRRFPEEGRS